MPRSIYLIFIFFTHHCAHHYINIIATIQKIYQDDNNDYQITTITPHGTKDITKNAQIFVLSKDTSQNYDIGSFTLDTRSKLKPKGAKAKKVPKS